MKNILSAFLMILLFSLLFSCQDSKEKHFLSNPDYRAQVTTDFEALRREFEPRSPGLFDIFEEVKSLEEKEALMFLYAYMPLSDLGNQDGSFFLQNVRLALMAIDSFPWGRDIGEDEFRHFVLPHRVNNEDLDTSRSVFFKELLPRIKNMNIEEAALEVNHWCHEKVNYQSTDSRTMGPLGVIRAAYGRCGEESTFTATALRSVGIPARQVYTPRWAHVDDNHAWVEVYVNGEWKYLGACEPEAVLNKGWFDGPVLRAMMVHTKAFGRYQGTEEVLGIFPKYTILNLLQNYAPVKQIHIITMDTSGVPVENAYFEFGLYNYAEFYPLKSGYTLADGKASITTGYGDIRVFVSDNEGHFGLQKITVEQKDTVEVFLRYTPGEGVSLSEEIIPPVSKIPVGTPTDKIEENNLRLAAEDEIRNSFVGTFYTEMQSNELAQQQNLEENRVWSLMQNARGNYVTIGTFLQNHGKNDSLALRLLETLAIKDLHDITSEVLEDHLTHFLLHPSNLERAMVDEYILCPRIDIEKLSPYRVFLQDKFKGKEYSNPGEAAAMIVDWIKRNIHINDTDNYYRNYLIPEGLNKLKTGDQRSINLFFVAAMRSLGFPARLEPASSNPQYYNKEWIDVSFNDAEAMSLSPKGRVFFRGDDRKGTELKYRIHFSLAKYDGRKFVTLELGWEKAMGAFAGGTQVPSGYYQLTIGNRMKDGSVLVDQTYFTLAEAEEKVVSIALREDIRPTEILGQWKNRPLQDQAMVYVWIDAAGESSTHLLNEMESLRQTFEKLDFPMMVFTQDQEDSTAISARLARLARIECDRGNALLDLFFEEAKLSYPRELPIVVMTDKEGNIYYFSYGYRIGTPEQIIKAYQRLIISD